MDTSPERWRHGATRAEGRGIAGFEDGVDGRFGGGRLGDGGPTIRPRLVTQRRIEDGFMDDPALRALDLEDEDVVDVVMVVEAWFWGGVMYALAWTGLPSSLLRAAAKSPMGAHVRCRAWRTRVAPSWN